MEERRGGASRSNLTRETLAADELLVPEVAWWCGCLPLGHKAEQQRSAAQAESA